MGHKVKIGLSILRTFPETMFLGFLNNETITCDLKDTETSIVTAIKLAKQYVDVDLENLDIQKAGFFSLSNTPPVIDAKTGEAMGDFGPTTYLWFRVKVSPSVKTSTDLEWVSVSNHDKLFQVPMYKFHLESMIG